jgi:phosphoribosylanthranilate isomerase
MVRVKICGCRSPEDALAAAEAGADFVGLMFAESRRRISVDEAGEVVRALGTPLRALEQTEPPALHRLEGSDQRSWFEHGAEALERMLQRKRPLTVGVFAGAEAEEINEIVDEAGIDLVQLSGPEAWGQCLLVSRQVIKAVHVGPGEAARSVIGRIEAGSAIAVMLDRKKGRSFGGNGEVIDWDCAAAVAAAMPMWLAGGLTPENVPLAIGRVRPWAVDVSSGVETDGLKDYGKIRRFVRAVHS